MNILNCFLERNRFNYQSLVDCLREFPENIRPYYLGGSEEQLLSQKKMINWNALDKDNPSTMFSNKSLSAIFDISERPMGFYCIGISSNEYSEYANLEKALELFVNLDPFFGFCCDESELKHRNHVCRRIRGQLVEAWLGRSFVKGVSGIYWRTYLSKRALHQFSIELDIISDIAKEIRINDAGTIVKMYESPKHWLDHAHNVDAMCQRIDGIFSQTNLDIEIGESESVMEYISKLNNWR